MKEWQLAIKPTFMNELQAFPEGRSGVLLDKMRILVTDPFPDGKVKKRLKGGDGIHRLRVGDHRVFYRFGDDWVSLLSIRKRDESTYDALPSGVPARPSAPDDEDVEDVLDELLAAPEQRSFEFGAAPESQPLPVAITADWLRDLGVPPAAFPHLVRCKTEDDLLNASVSQDVLTRVLDAVFPPNLEDVARQPDLVVPSTEDLIRYKQGDLVGFLLRLDDDQKRLATWALKGPTMVRGGAGTGKSTVALYRVKEVLDRAPAAGQTVLFTTFTNALVKATRQLLEQILDEEQMKRVQVTTVDKLVRNIVASTRTVGKLESDGDAAKRLRSLRRRFTSTAGSAFEAKIRARALARLSDRYLLEEFTWIIDGRGLATFDAYKESPRPGRGVPFPERLRETVWDLYQAFVADGGHERFPALRNEALEIARADASQRRWDHVFVDEAQDLSPAALALMAEICRSPEGLFFAADSKQSLYSRNYTWSSAHPHLQFKGRTAVLRRNYRSTREIDRAAFGVLRPEDGEALETSESVHEGPIPVLVRDASTGAEAEWIAQFVRQMARHLRLRQSAAAVLVPSAVIGKALAGDLDDQGIRAKYYRGHELDLQEDVVKVMTLYSAKGLEFPIVAVAGLHDGTYPVPEDFDEHDLYLERMRHERRLLYVGMTRAMRGLMVIAPAGTRHEALTELNTDDWHVEESE